MSPEAMCVAKVIKNTHDYYSEGVSSMKNEVSSRCYYKGTASDFRTCSTRICPGSFPSNNHRMRSTKFPIRRRSAGLMAPLSKYFTVTSAATS